MSCFLELDEFVNAKLLELGVNIVDNSVVNVTDNDILYDFGADTLDEGNENGSEIRKIELLIRYREKVENGDGKFKISNIWSRINKLFGNIYNYELNDSTQIIYTQNITNLPENNDNEIQFIAIWHIYYTEQYNN